MFSPLLPPQKPWPYDMHAPTDEQARVRSAAVDLLHEPRGIIKTLAGAGCGKTTTLIGSAADCKKAGATRLCYLALNKPLVETGQESFKNLAIVKTFNALAFEGANVASSNRKIGNIYPAQVVEAFGLQSKRLPTDVSTFARIVLAVVSSFCQSSATEISASHLPYWVKDATVAALALKYASVLFQAACPGVNTSLPLPHDLYVKAWQLRGCPGLGQYDFVFLDEAQDAAGVTLSCLAYAKRACYVGDAAQQIYAFRGAQDVMLKVPGRTYPLSLSFRFGEEIAEAANRVISSKSNRSEVLLRGLPGKGSTIGPIQRGEPQTRIFRTNTSVLKEALNLSDLGVTTQIVGDMSEMRHKIEGAYSLLKGATHEVKHPAFQQFKNWDELEGWMYRNQDTEITQIANLVKAYVRRIDALLKICSKQPSSGEVMLITAHRAKGCEWDNVVIGQDFDERLDGLLLNGRSRSPQADEELNLLYVALTRTRKRLESKSEALKSILK